MSKIFKTRKRSFGLDKLLTLYSDTWSGSYGARSAQPRQFPPHMSGGAFAGNKGHLKWQLHLGNFSQYYSTRV